MVTLRRAAEQALAAIKSANQVNYSWACVEAVAALETALAEDALQRLTDVQQDIEAALAEPNQEPVFDCPRCGHCCPQRKPLTEEEIRAIRDTYYRQMGPIEFARAIEAAIRNRGKE